MKSRKSGNMFQNRFAPCNFPGQYSSFFTGDSLKCVNQSCSKMSFFFYYYYQSFSCSNGADLRYSRGTFLPTFNFLFSLDKESFFSCFFKIHSIFSQQHSSNKKMRLLITTARWSVSCRITRGHRNVLECQVS